MFFRCSERIVAICLPRLVFGIRCYAIGGSAALLFCHGIHGGGVDREEGMDGGVGDNLLGVAEVLPYVGEIGRGERGGVGVEDWEYAVVVEGAFGGAVDVRV